MPKKRFSPEQIIAKLRQIEVQLAQGKSIARSSEFGAGTRTAPKHTPALSTKDSTFREEIDPSGFGSAHLASNGEAKHRWERQGRRYS
jgi:hypothetical protein